MLDYKEENVNKLLSIDIMSRERLPKEVIAAILRSSDIVCMFTQLLKSCLPSLITSHYFLIKLSISKKQFSNILQPCPYCTPLQITRLVVGRTHTIIAPFYFSSSKPKLLNTSEHFRLFTLRILRIVKYVIV